MIADSKLTAQPAMSFVTYCNFHETLTLMLRCDFKNQSLRALVHFIQVVPVWVWL